MDIGKTFYPPGREEWHDWLVANHQSEPEIWLVYYNKASGKPRVSYNDAVEEALCFGWIDSTTKKHSEESFAQRFTPRRRNSPVSAMNQERARRLIEQGRMTPAGLACLGDLSTDFTVPDDILAALQEDPQTWENFERFPDSYKRIRVAFVEGARNRPPMFSRRLAYLVKMTAANKRFGMVQ